MRANEFPLTAKIGAAGLGGFFLATLVAGAVKPGYNHLREAMSALAALDSPAAPVMIAGFMAAAISLIASGVGIWRRLGTGVAGRIAAVMVAIGGGLMVAAGLARQDCSDRLESCIDHGEATLASGHFWVHQFVSLALFLLLAIGLFVLARGLKRNAGWRHLAWPTRFAGLFAVACIAELIVDPPALNPYAGLVQRLFLLVLFGWPLLVAALPARSTDGTDGTAAGSTHPGVRAAQVTLPRSTVLTERTALTPAWAGWVEPMRPGTLR